MCDRLPVGPAGLPTTTWLAQSGDLDDPVEDLNVSTLQGWMPCTRHTRVTVPSPTSTCDTRSCESQCVTRDLHQAGTGRSHPRQGVRGLKPDTEGTAPVPTYQLYTASTSACSVMLR